ncbi:MAG: RNA methyltransferase [Pseudomonadota bacterium]
MSGIDLYLALIHHPVVNKKGAIIASALTTIDMHDIARAAMTFGARGLYVVTPLEDQKILGREVIDHWTRGIGGELNPFRKEALELIRITSTFAEAVADIEKRSQGPVTTAATSAAAHKSSTGINEFAAMLDRNTPHIIAFGTAWGLSPDFIRQCDHILEPVWGTTGYNHLSVRSAVSIILDRLVNGRGVVN